MILLISLLGAAAVFIALYVLFFMQSSKQRVVHNRLRSMSGWGEGPDKDIYWKNQMNRSFGERIIQPVVDKIAARIADVAPSGLRRSAEDLVEASGGFYKIGYSGFMIVWGVCILIFAIIGIRHNFTQEQSLIMKIVKSLFVAGVGAYLPFFWIKRLIAKRHKAILQSMPDVLDLLCVSVQAGLGFDGALGKVTAKLKGPLIEEFERLLQELRMGVTRRQALTRLAKRCGIQEMQLFTAAIIQADKLGVGLAQTLEIQSGNMREARRQRAKEEAAKLPVKILFPTMIFIFPVMFVVVLGPAIVSLVNSLGK